MVAAAAVRDWSLTELQVVVRTEGSLGATQLPHLELRIPWGLKEEQEFPYIWTVTVSNANVTGQARYVWETMAWNNHNQC